MGCSLELEAVLRDARAPGVRRVLVVIGVCGGVFGAAMGSYGGAPLQILFSALKVPLLVAVSTALCIPSLFVVHLVVGLHRDFADVLRAVATAQGVVAVTLAALAPVIGLFYASCRDYQLAQLFLGGVFFVASVAGQMRLGTQYRALIARDSRHVWGRRLWLALYVAVTIQMAWVLRPFVGNPDMPTQFFREDSWGNAYLHVLGTLRQVLGW